ncbi:MAG: outer membrane beta-barrel protein [Planctomycetes bacterium]|nr:outer membrane beta-barrel protein [Planctomycetota bacterium]
MAISTRLILVVLPLVTACAAAPTAAPYQHFAQYQTKLQLDVGKRSPDSAFEPVDEHTSYGIEAVISQPGARGGLELGLFYSTDEETRDVSGGRTKFKGTMTEFSVGGRWEGDLWYAHSRPYASAGASLLFPKYSERPDSGSSRSDSGWAIGPYIRGGLEWTLTDNLTIALDYRQVLLSNIVHDVSFGNSHADANYQQLGIVLGWQF